MVRGIDPSRVPAHVAMIMDGNGRWAKKRRKPRTEGHVAGETAIMDAIEGSIDLGIDWLTFFAFSTENWRRPVAEVRFLMNFNERLLLKRRDELNDRGVRIRTIGRRPGRIPRRVLRRIEETEALTARNKVLNLTFAFNYGGRAELVDAVKAIARAAASGELDPTRVTERTVARHLYAPEIPDPDLLIRTSGEHRLSNFLLWESAYAELMFLPVLWPDFRRDHLFDAIREYQQRERRFGQL